MGYDFSLQIVLLGHADYQNELKEYENENGPLDIVFTGFNVEGEGDKPLAMIKSGYFAQLDEFLNTSEGVKLFDLYDEKLWESVKVDNNIYTIPPSLGYGGITFAFNKAYINEEDIKNFTGDLSDLEQYMDKIPFSENFSHIVLDLSNIGLFALIDCDYKDGLIFTRDKRKAYNPYEYDEYREINEVISDYRKSEYINYEFGFGGSSGHSDSDEVIRNDITNYLNEGKFFVYIGEGSDLTNINADLITYEKPGYVNTNLGANTGISANSENKEEAFQLLSLAYTDKELANLLVYGVDGVDYKLENEKAYTLEGEPYDAFMKHICLGIYEMTYPSGDEDVETSRLADKKKHFQDKVEVSPYMGFNFYNEEHIPAINKLEEMVGDNCDVWQSEDMNAEWDRINKELKKAGIDELVTAVNEALDEYFE